MNIFALDADPIVAAQNLCDQHLGKMLLESCQLLCNVHREPVGAVRKQWLQLRPVERAKLGLLPYKHTHYNNRFSVWARASNENWLWLWQHAQALAMEYCHRFGKRHGSELVLDWLEPCYLGLPAKGLTPFALPEGYQSDDAVAAYRRYYAAEKMILRGKPVTWTRRERPVWLLEQAK